MTTQRSALIVTVAIAGVAALAQGALAWWRPWDPGAGAGLAFGILAAVLFGLGLVYAARRRLRARPFGTAQRWLAVHIYGSVIAMLSVLLHTGWSLPHGIMGWLLFLLAAWTTISGLIGRWLQRRIATQLARDVSYEAIFERIPALVEALAKEADAMMAGASEALDRAYRGEIRPSLAKPAFSFGWLSGSVAMRAQAVAPLTAARGYVAPADGDRVASLETILKDKGDLDQQFALQQVLRGWLVLHVPPAFALAGMVVVHITAAIWY
jgi:hypothetical protein